MSARSRDPKDSACPPGAPDPAAAGSASPDRDTDRDELFHRAAELLHRLSERSRLVIVQHLLLGEHRVVDLQNHLGLAQSTVSKHLAILQDGGLVTARSAGRASLYSLTHPDQTRALLAASDLLLEATGNAVTGVALAQADVTLTHIRPT